MGTPVKRQTQLKTLPSLTPLRGGGVKMYLKTEMLSICSIKSLYKSLKYFHSLNAFSSESQAEVTI